MFKRDIAENNKIFVSATVPRTFNVKMTELISCPRLQGLDLSYNEIGDKGAIELADGLKDCKSLQSLNLKGNKIGDEGSIGLADKLKDCKSLQSLDLVGNNIGDEGAMGQLVVEVKVHY